MNVFHKGDMNNHMEENEKKSSTAQETSAEESVHPVAEPVTPQLDKELKKLVFQNPGPQVSNFNAEIRKWRKKAHKPLMNQDCFNKPLKSLKKYGTRGWLLGSNIDLCDCLETDCLGCFYPCPKCNSTKCGPECRCNRKWVYDTIETEDGNVISAFPFSTKP
ncbi:ARL14 effector protein-like [Cyrtonyx montezumae]|uniref:ARL14 effector protein-like n=1 Tax=Cyrtonyx montezumae TaxID=9017 RepID=UPI0032D9C2A2